MADSVEVLESEPNWIHPFVTRCAEWLLAVHFHELPHGGVTVEFLRHFLEFGNIGRCGGSGSPENVIEDKQASIDRRGPGRLRGDDEEGALSQDSAPAFDAWFELHLAEVPSLYLFDAIEVCEVFVEEGIVGIE